jgi:hypothetical protein
MTICVLSYVWENSAHGGAELLVMLALADGTMPDGEGRASVPRLACRARITPDETRAILDKMLEDKEFVYVDYDGDIVYYKMEPSVFCAPPVAQRSAGNTPSIIPSPKAGRDSSAYGRWRDAVFERDNDTCQNCGNYCVQMYAHHIAPWASYPELRFSVDNGVTLCQRCHAAAHRGARRG